MAHELYFNKDYMRKWWRQNKDILRKNKKKHGGKILIEKKLNDDAMLYAILFFFAFLNHWMKFLILPNIFQSPIHNDELYLTNV